MANTTGKLDVDDVANLVTLHRVLHTSWITHQAIFRSIKPDKSPASCRYKGRLLSVLNINKRYEYEPDFLRKIKARIKAGYRVGLTWISNPGWNSGVSGKIISEEKDGKGVFTIYKFLDDRSEVLIYPSTPYLIESPTLLSPEPGIQYVHGNILDSSAELLVCSASTTRVLGAGLSNLFRLTYPEILEPYKTACSEGIFDIGKVFYLEPRGRRICLLATKKDWKETTSSLDYVESGLQALLRTIGDTKSIALPALGCHLGRLKWEEDIKPMMERMLGMLNIPVYIHLDHGALTIPADKPEPQEQPQLEPQTIVEPSGSFEM